MKRTLHILAALLVVTAGWAQSVALENGCEARIRSARAARARFDYAEALRILEEASRACPGSAAIEAERGMLFLAAEDPGRALRYFETALGLDPSLPAARIGRAGVDLFDRDYISTESRLRQVIAAFPEASPAPERRTDLSRAHTMLAAVMLETGRQPEAGLEASRALALDASNTSALYTLAFLRAEERKPVESRDFARRALEADPLHPAARRLYSQYVNGQAGQEQMLPEAIKEKLERARTLKDQGKAGPAAAELETVLKEEPRCWRALISLGSIRLAEENYREAARLARLAIEVDSEGSLGHLQLSCAAAGLQEQARIAIGARDFRSVFYAAGSDTPGILADESISEVFPDYRGLDGPRKAVIRVSISGLARFLPQLAAKGARYYLLPLDLQVTDLGEFRSLKAASTFDGRSYASLRGVGGNKTVTGIESLDVAARCGYNTIAHEFAHQVHLSALSPEEADMIRELYRKAVREGRTLDFYAAADEYEYFAQGYEAFVSSYKRPAAGVTGRHTRAELRQRDPDLFEFLNGLARRPRSIE